MNRRTIEKLAAAILVIALIVSLIPLLGISYYDHPCADDYSYGLMAHQAYVQGGGIVEVVAAAIEKVVERYVNWQGTFSSIFLMALQPAVFGDVWYRITPWIMLGMLIFSMFALLKEILKGVLKSNTAQYFLISAGLILVSIQLMLVPVEGIYWYNGAVHYIFMYSLMLWLIRNLIRFMRTDEMWCLLSACLFGFIIGGGNYVTALTVILLEAIVIGFLLLYRRKNWFLLLVPMGFSVVSLVLSGIAPGNRVRQSDLQQSSIMGAVLQSFKDAVHFIRVNTSILYILFLLFLIPFIVYMVSESKVYFRLPLLMPVISYCLISAMFAPMEYTAGIAYVGRTGNVILLMIQLLGVLNEIYLIGWIVSLKKFASTDTKFVTEELSSTDTKPIRATRAAREKKAEKAAWLLVFCICIAAVSGFTVYKTYRTQCYTSITAVLSWKSGEIPSYDQQIKDRLVLLEDESVEKVKLPELTQKPYLLYFDDITPDKKDWRNKAMARFYSKKSVKLVTIES